MTYWLSKLFSKLVCLLPHGFAMWLGEILGHITWWFVPKKRRDMAVAQVVRCLGVDGQEGLRIARASWERFGPMIMEVMRFPVTVSRMKDFVRIEGAEYLEEGLKEGKGAVIATSHAGNWELMGGALCQAGFPIVGVAQKQKEAGFDKFINEYRRLIGMHITYKTDVREMYKLMGKGKIIGLLSDQDSDIRDGIRFPWFGGQLTNFVKGPAVLARFRGAPLYPGFITRHPDGTHTIIIHPRIKVEKTDDKEADIRKAIMEVSAVLEKHIRDHAEEWFWLHNRWKSINEERTPEDVARDTEEQAEWRKRGL